VICSLGFSIETVLLDREGEYRKLVWWVIFNESQFRDVAQTAIIWQIQIVVGLLVMLTFCEEYRLNAILCFFEKRAIR